MLKLSVILTFAFLLTIPISFAVFNATNWIYDDSVIALAKFDTNLTLDNSHNNNLGSIEGNPTHNDTHFVVGNASASFNGTGDMVRFPSLPAWQNHAMSTNFSICAWYNYTTPGDNDNNLIAGRLNVGSAETGFALRWDDRVSQKVLVFLVFEGGFASQAQFNNSEILMQNGNFHFICGVANMTGNDNTTSLWIDGKLSNASANRTFPLPEITFDLLIGARDSDGAFDLIGDIDEVSYHNKSLNKANITHMYNNGLGVGFEFEAQVDTTAPVITINSPANNSAINTFPITTVDLTVTDASVPINCTLRNTSDIFNTSSGNSGNFLLNFTTNNIEQDFSLNITCIDSLSLSNTQLLNLTVDTIQPVITFNQPVNNSLHKNIPLDITCFDDFVFILNATLFNSSGSLAEVQNDTTASAAEDGTLSLINQEIDTSALVDAAYTLNVTCSDSHTRNEIEDYVISAIGAAGFRYETAEGNDVQITLIGSPLSTPATTKHTDRYWIEFGIIASKENHTFKVVTAQNTIQILDTGIKGHLLVSNGEHGNWIDFENGDETSTVVVERITDKMVDVHVFSNNFNFRSIGGLNINSQFHNISTDNTIPSSTSISVSNSTPETTDVIQLNVTCTDTNGIDLIEVANNVTTFQNVSSFDFANQTPAIASYNHTVSIAGTIINEFTCTDTVGNSVQANFIYNSTAKGTVQNTLETFNYSAFLSFMAITIVIVLLVTRMVKKKK